MDVNALTLAFISLAGFGKQVTWRGKTAENEDIPKGYKMDFLKAVIATTDHMIAILLLPRWLLRLSPLRNPAVGHSQLEKYMREMIRSEQKEIKIDESQRTSKFKGNLLSELLKASALDADSKTSGPGERKEAFTENEVMGNMFIYLLAGTFLGCLIFSF